MQAPIGMSTFEFVVVSSLRAAQLSRGCTPKVEVTHKRIVLAQMEVAERKIVRIADAVVVEV
jgi:DNA-directed RNA polymerase subunit K/omega